VDHPQLIPKVELRVKSLKFFIQWGGVIFIFGEIRKPWGLKVAYDYNNKTFDL
jgi:hypothetical protein